MRNPLRNAIGCWLLAGRFVKPDNNSAAGACGRGKNYAVWRTLENRPHGIALHDHNVKSSYVSMRKEIVKEYFPALKEEEVERLAQGTSGMDAEEIQAACEQYIATGEMPRSYFVPTECPLNPRTGIYIENMLQAYELAALLRTIGFKSRVWAYLCGAGRGGIFLKINAVWSALSPLTIYLSRGYRIVAEK